MFSAGGPEPNSPVLGTAGRVLYWGSGSSASWRVLLALELKHLTYQSEMIEFSR
jgi:hypothetical protein